MSSNGSLSIKGSTGATYSATQNPSGAIAKSSQAAATSPPLVVMAAGGVMTMITDQSAVCTITTDGQVMWNRAIGTWQACDFYGAGWSVIGATSTLPTCNSLSASGLCHSSSGATLYYVGLSSGLRVVMDLSDASAGIRWFNGTYSLIQPTSSDGLVNTNKIISVQGAGSYAAKLCAEKGAGWHLPTSGELSLAYSNKIAIGGFSNAYYWITDEYDMTQAYLLDMTNNGMARTDKSSPNRVRCVRHD